MLEVFYYGDKVVSGGFGASAWVGPTYRSGEERIVFLNPIPRRHRFETHSPQTGAAQLPALGVSPRDTDPRQHSLEPCKGRLNPCHAAPHPASRLAAKRRPDVSLV